MWVTRQEIISFVQVTDTETHLRRWSFRLSPCRSFSFFFFALLRVCNVGHKMHRGPNLSQNSSLQLPSIRREVIPRFSSLCFRWKILFYLFRRFGSSNQRNQCWQLTFPQSDAASRIDCQQADMRNVPEKKRSPNEFLYYGNFLAVVFCDFANNYNFRRRRMRITEGGTTKIYVDYVQNCISTIFPYG